jgi:photosystem II stability/assembly factor-like uncharacterized protein
MRQVFIYGLPGNRSKDTAHSADLFPYLSQSAITPDIDFFAENQNGTRIGRQVTDQNSQQRRFSGAGRTDNYGGLVSGQREIEPVKNLVPGACGEAQLEQFHDIFVAIQFDFIRRSGLIIKNYYKQFLISTYNKRVKERGKNMRHSIFILSVVAFLAVGAGGAEWRQIPSGTFEDFHGLFFINDSLGYVVTNRGNIMKFYLTDSVWKIDTTSTAIVLMDIYFPGNGAKGFAFGAKGHIIKTEDSGKQWSKESHDSLAWFEDMVFLDSSSGMVVGYKDRHRGVGPGVGWITSDGGKTWNPLEIKAMGVSSVDKSSSGILTVTGRERLFISRDSLNSWDKIEVPGKREARAAAIEGNRGIIVGMKGFLALSEDGGKTWGEKEIISITVSLHDVIMMDSKKAYAVGSKGYILYTDDSGRNWIPEFSRTTFDLHDVQVVGNKIFACGDRGTLLFAELDH